MTLELILSILGAAIVFALVRFVMKKPWAVSILAGLMVLLAVNIHWPWAPTWCWVSRLS